MRRICGTVSSRSACRVSSFGEAHGGVGLTTLDAATVAQALGAAIAPVPFIGNRRARAARDCTRRHADQQAEWLPRIAAGEIDRRRRPYREAASGAREGAKVTASAGKLSGKTLFVLDFEADAYLVADASPAAVS